MSKKHRPRGRKTSHPHSAPKTASKVQKKPVFQAATPQKVSAPVPDTTLTLVMPSAARSDPAARSPQPDPLAALVMPLPAPLAALAAPQPDPLAAQATPEPDPLVVLAIAAQTMREEAPSFDSGVASDPLFSLTRHAELAGTPPHEPSITLVPDSDSSITLIPLVNPLIKLDSPFDMACAKAATGGGLSRDPLPDSRVTPVPIEEAAGRSKASLKEQVGAGSPTSFYLRSMSPRGATTPGEEIDQAFFAQEAETVARLHAEATTEVWVERAPRPAPSREVLARRGRLRAVVASVVGAMALMAGPIVGQALGLSRPHDWTALPATPIHAAASRAPLVLAAEEEESPEENHADPPRPTDPARAKELTSRALGRLEAGKYREAIDLATNAIEADPTDAAPYLYKGTALLETGQNSAARGVFARCVEQATRGQKQECRHFR